MQFFLIPNREKKEAPEFALEIKSYIESIGSKAVIASNGEQDTECFTNMSEIPEDTDFIITLGGDGTLIRAARDLYELEIPILGVNLGTIGFLTEIDGAHCKEAILSLARGEHFVEERMMVSGSVYRNGEKIYENYALNEIALLNGTCARAMQYEFCVNGEHLKTYIANGMILATPTGSTAYNLSVGGPIALPDGKMILATPINPHTLLARSIVLPDTAEIRLVVRGKEYDTASVTFDSITYSNLVYGDEIRVHKCEHTAKLVKVTKDSFLEVLRKKLE